MNRTSAGGSCLAAVLLSLAAVVSAAAGPLWLRVAAALSVLAATVQNARVQRLNRAARTGLEQRLTDEAEQKARIGETLAGLAGQVAAIRYAVQESLSALTRVRSAWPDLLEDAALAKENTAARRAYLAEAAGELADILAALEESRRSALGGRSNPAPPHEEPAEAGFFTDESMNRLSKTRALLTEETQSMEAAMARAGKAAAETGRSMRTVTDLAEQARILGVNASIEALRAGEAGRGFTLIAEDAERLADKLSKAAHQMAVRVEDEEKILVEAGKTLGRIMEAVEQANLLDIPAAKAAWQEQARERQAIAGALAGLGKDSGVLARRLSGLHASLAACRAEGEEGAGRVCTVLQEAETDLCTIGRFLADVKAGAEAAAGVIGATGD